MSQKALADAVGVVERTIGGWERGENSPGLAEPRLLDVLAPYLSTTTPETPVTYDTLDARLANHDRQIDALWRRLDELGGGRSVDGHPAGGGPDATVTEFRPRTGPPEPPSEAPPIPDDLAADDPEEPTEYERRHEAEHGDDNTGR